MATSTNGNDGAGKPAGEDYAIALAVPATVFFMWGFVTVLNDILVPHLKAVFQLNYGQSLLIQFVFYLAYLLVSLPAAKLLEDIGYKQSIVVGLVGMASSALFFVPAARLASYALFLAALFMLASAITLRSARERHEVSAHCTDHERSALKQLSKSEWPRNVQ